MVEKKPIENCVGSILEPRGDKLGQLPICIKFYKWSFEGSVMVKLDQIKFDLTIDNL